MTRVGTVLLRRIKFIAVAAYWTNYHCSFALGVWVANFLGYRW